MQLVIDISEEQYALIRSRIALIREEMRKKGYCNDDIVPVGWVAIADGTILPKGHGDLIDRITVQMSAEKFHSLGDLHTAQWELNNAPTVIPADKEDDNEQS